MTGIDDVWPDDPMERIVLTIEPVTSPFRVEYVIDRAEVTEEIARRELSQLEEKGWVEQVGADEWRVNDDARIKDGLLPYDE